MLQPEKNLRRIELRHLNVQNESVYIKINGYKNFDDFLNCVVKLNLFIHIKVISLILLTTSNT